ncbi:hypothetical protein [Mycolicibacterium hodleri]|uniref:hypothetical protein n=1 Tax=Mycolicibacterium hodleri TaxID=49897 RepID=UPI0011288869|nr:hypothetical protein [Mycolicibacterium hodleri]
MAIGAAPLPLANSATTPGSSGLPPMLFAPEAPDPAPIPDLTFGLGPRGDEAFQTYGAQLENGLSQQRQPGRITRVPRRRPRDRHYVGIGPVALLQALRGRPGVTDADKLILDPLILTVQGIFGDAGAVDVRIPIVTDFGLGAFAAGQA